MKFLSDNFLYISLLFVSGGMLLWPLIQRRQQGEAVNPNGAIALMNQDDALLLDVRSTDEFARGHVAQAKNIPAADLVARAAEVAKNPCIVVLDADGKTAGKAAAALRTAGAARVVVLDGGYAMWLAAGLPVKK
jgi:rhodanese-related sulfurtransferase